MWLLYTLVLMSHLNPNKHDDFHIHMDYVILYGFMEGKWMIWYDMKLEEHSFEDLWFTTTLKWFTRALRLIRYCFYFFSWQYVWDLCRCLLLSPLPVQLTTWLPKLNFIDGFAVNWTMCSFLLLFWCTVTFVIKCLS